MLENTNKTVENTLDTMRALAFLRIVSSEHLEVPSQAAACDGQTSDNTFGNPCNRTN